MNTTPEATPVPEWFADDPMPALCTECGVPYDRHEDVDQPELCSQCYMDQMPLFEVTDTLPMKQQLVDAFCNDCHDRIDQWFITFRHIWDSLED
jgi:NMD protein affecting ribosome stability and mRNA decay